MNRKDRSAAGVWLMRLLGGALVAGSALLILSCGSDSASTPTEPRAWYYESEFTGNPSLMAVPGQVVILDIFPGEGLSAHPIPYQYEEGGGYLFAVPWDDPFITRADILDRSGVRVATAERGDGGVYLEMSPGDYSIRVYHEGKDVPEQGSAAFIRRQDERTIPSATAAPVHSATQETSPIDPVYPAYVAVRLVSGDYQGQYLASVSGSVWEDGHSVTVRLLKTVSVNTSGDVFQERGHLFSFETQDSNRCGSGSYPPFAGNYLLHSWPAETAGLTFTYDGFACDWTPKCPPSQDNFPFQSGWTSMPLFHPHEDSFPFPVEDMGGGVFVPWPYAFYTLPCSTLYAAENGYVYFTEFSTTASPVDFEIVDGFRFYTKGSQINRRDLKKGEVALYEGKNYTGAAVILSATFKETTLIPLKQVQSVAFGLYTTTTVQLYSRPDFGGELIRTVGVDMPKGLNISGAEIGSIKIFDSWKVFIASKKCPYCNLAGVDLSSLSLDGADLFNADLMAADIHHASLKKANLSGALLNGANLTNANLSGASLLGASLNAYSPLNLDAAILSGAYLRNANCKGADLGGVNFENASFHTWALSYNEDGCDQDTDNPPFTKECASAQGANMDGAIFSNAYLAGTDFSGVTATGAIFSNAVLTGAIFRGAHLDWPSSSGRGVTFRQAFIGGADFQDATVEGAIFTDAYVGCPSNGCIRFRIPDTHTHFPGFDDTNGTSPCVEFDYPQGTVVPQTKENNTCPDGSRGPCGIDCDQGTWTNPNTPRHDPSNLANSDCTDMPENCTEIDYTW